MNPITRAPAAAGPLPSARPPPSTGPPARAFVHVLGEGAARAPPPVAARAPTAPATPASSGIPPPRRILEASFAAERRLDQIIAAAGRGKTFSAAELIALQAEVFRYSQVVEVVSRTTDKVVGGLKQVLGTQV